MVCSRENASHVKFGQIEQEMSSHDALKDGRSTQQGVQLNYELLVVPVTEMDGLTTAYPDLISIDLREMNPSLRDEIVKMIQPHTPASGLATVEEPLIRDRFYFQMVLFEVDETEFLVPAQHFLANSYFALLINVSEARAKNDPPAIPIEGVSATDFRALLSLMYPLDPFNSTLSQSEWISILRLSSRWKMTRYRQLALRSIDENLLSVDDLLSFGRGFGILSWYERATTALVERAGPVTINDAQRWGVELASKVARTKELMYRSAWSLFHLRYSPRRYPSLLTVFSEELKGFAGTQDLVQEAVRARNNGACDWLLSLYERIVDREEGLSIQDVDCLGLVTAVKIWEERLNRRRSYLAILKRDFSVLDTTPCSEIATGLVVREEFGSEIREIKELDETLSPPSPISESRRRFSQEWLGLEESSGRLPVRLQRNRWSEPVPAVQSRIAT